MLSIIPAGAFYRAFYSGVRIPFAAPYVSGLYRAETYMHDPTPFLPSTAPRDGREFMGQFLTDEGPKFAVARFEDGRFRREKDGEWFDLTNRQTLRYWGEIGPTIIGPGF